MILWPLAYLNHWLLALLERHGPMAETLAAHLEAATALSYVRAQLAEGKVEPLKEELKIPVGATQEGMVIFSFPVAKPAFDGRKSFTLRVDFYDHAPMVLKQ